MTQVKWFALCLALMLGSVFSLQAQDFTVKRVELAQGKVNIYYEIVDTLARSYTINVYASRDNFIAPLEKISGDAGLEVLAGKEKKIVWDAPAELGTFDGKIALP